MIDNSRNLSLYFKNTSAITNRRDIDNSYSLLLMQVSILNIPVIATALIDSALPDLHTYPRQRFICEYFAQLSQVFTPATRPKIYTFQVMRKSQKGNGES